MRHMKSPRIGSIFGIDIELHWVSAVFLIMFLLVSLYLFFLMLLLLLSVLIHELAHSVTAIKNKIKVSKIIILLPIGGLSVLDDTNLPSNLEFNIALAGPIMSIFLGLLFGIFVPFAPPGLLTQTLQFMFEMNILLGVLNLLPAFPTDGGRVFRSYLEKKMSRYKATMLTVRISKDLMYLLMFGTIVYVFVASSPLYYKETLFIIMLFTIFILYGGAESEQQMAELREKAENKDYFFIDWNATIGQLYKKIKAEKRHIAITGNKGTYFFVNVFDKKKLENARKVFDLAVEIPSIDENANVVDALEILENKEANIAAVVRRKKIVAIVTAQHLDAFISLHIIQKNRKGAGEK